MTSEKRKAQVKAWRKRNPDSHKRANSRWYQKNKKRIREQRIAHYERNVQKEVSASKLYRKKHPRKIWAARILRAYGLSELEYEIMLAIQGGVCGICKREYPGKKKSWSVDHCHATGKVRGLLCQWCNRGIGIMRDDPTILRAAADYLEVSRA